MKFSQVLVLASLPVNALSSPSNWFRGVAQPDLISEDVNAPIESPIEQSSRFKPSELLDFSARKPEAYTNAIVVLKNLEQKPICHRTAAQLLMDNCHGIEENDASSDQWGSAHIQRHHVESFANGLTMCDMERARFVTPEACSPFGSSALCRASRDKHSQLGITQAQVTDCLEALGGDERSWSTWLSNRDKAVTICRAARLDIEKDQAILVHKQLVELMQQFTSGVDDDLTRLREHLKASSRFAKSFVDDLTNQAENGKAKLNSAFETVSEDIKGVDSVVKSILSSGTDVLHMFKLSMQTVLQGNAEMASEQEQALAVATDAFQQRVGGINNAVGQTEASVLVIQDALQQLVPMVVALHERQNALEEKAQSALSAVMNATELLQSHTQHLQQASIKASGINDDLDKAVAIAQTWQENLRVSGSMPDWVFRAGTPMAALSLGNFGIARSTGGNIGLAGAGFVVGESLVVLRHVQWPNLFNLCTMNLFRTSSSQPQQQVNMSSLPPKALSEMSPSSSSTYQTNTDEVHIDMV
ncbi:uncharacterized protein LY89DRAFT_776894 [Mollisia scopiformis]|uniref:Uncharacterized protein n=1 Tax=Mollisia scopiformis TaxID=149040 RepID=A0A194XTQ6_MOLSC|nr:uncharacterized protein LY89DRAFT_776894 [Mollisia scopiformis]KUJ23082.1 hypothetical protein LY89DRAFT_776894 [Mollisia scopiformis]